MAKEEHETPKMREKMRVKWYDFRKGYGFLVTPDGEDVMIHASVLNGAGVLNLAKQWLIDATYIERHSGLRVIYVHGIEATPVIPITELADYERTAGNSTAHARVLLGGNTAVE